MAELQLTNAGPLAAATTGAAKRGGTAAGGEKADGFSDLLAAPAQGSQAQAERRAAAGDATATADAENGEAVLELVPLDDDAEVMLAVPGWPPQPLGAAMTDSGSSPQPAVVPDTSAGDLAEPPAAIPLIAVAAPAAQHAAPAARPVASAVALEKPAPAAGLLAPASAAASQPLPAAAANSAAAAGAPPEVAAPLPPIKPLPAAVADARSSAAAAPLPEAVKPMSAAHTAVTAVHPVMQMLEQGQRMNGRALVSETAAPLVDAAARPGMAATGQAAGIAATAPAAAGTLVNTQSPQWVNQTATVLVYQAGAGANHARLIMHPAELGTVQVDLHLGADRRVDIVMTADTPAARDLMEQNAQQLRERLSEQGMTAGQLDVGVREQRAGGGSDQEQAGTRGEAADDGGAEAGDGGETGRRADGQVGLLDAYA